MASLWKWQKSAVGTQDNTEEWNTRGAQCRECEASKDQFNGQRRKKKSKKSEKNRKWADWRQQEVKEVILAIIFSF